MRKILLAVTLIAMLCGVSSADMVYMTSSGNLGTIQINSSSDIEVAGIQYTGTTSSPLLTSYWNGRGTTLALIDRNATASGDRAYVFTPNDLTKYSYSADIDGVYGTSGAGYAENGYSLFLTAGSMIYEVETSNFEVLNSFDCASVISSDGYATEIKDIIVGTQTIHVIASAGESLRYIRFDGQLKNGVNYFLSSDINAGSSVIQVRGDIPLIGHNFGIDAMNYDRKFYRLLSSDNPVKAICQDSGNGYFYAEQYQSGDKYVNTIMHSVEDSQFTPATIEAASANIKMLRDNNNTDTFAVMTNEGITLFTYSNNQTSRHEYKSSSLGGTPAGLVAATVSGYDGYSSSNGCNASGMGIIILGLAMLMRRVKRAE